METGKDEAWYSERIGNWVTLTGKVSGGDYEPTITPDPPTQEQQSTAAVSLAGKSVMYGGKAIFTSPDATSLYLQEELVLSNGDDIFIIGMNTGNKALPHLYKIFSVENGVCTAKDAFGNGDGNPIVTPTDDKDAVTITFNRFNPGKGLTEAWTYKDGTVSKAQAEGTSRP